MATGVTASDSGRRTYGQFCPIAAGLDVIGDRWVLLILRELSIGDRRFTDLRAALPGIAPNLLSDRLGALQSAGLVTTAELPPPAARTVYRLTEAGAAVGPVLRAVARFGVHFLEGEPSERFDSRRAAHALLAPWWRRGGTPLRMRVAIAGSAPVDVVTGDAVQVEDARDEPDAVLTTTVEALVAARRVGEPLPRAALTGTAPARREALAQFDLHTR